MYDRVKIAWNWHIHFKDANLFPMSSVASEWTSKRMSAVVVRPIERLGEGPNTQRVYYISSLPKPKPKELVHTLPGPAYKAKLGMSFRADLKLTVANPLLYSLFLVPYSFFLIPYSLFLIPFFLFFIVHAFDLGKWGMTQQGIIIFFMKWDTADQHLCRFLPAMYIWKKLMNNTWLQTLEFRKNVSNTFKLQKVNQYKKGKYQLRWAICSWFKWIEKTWCTCGRFSELLILLWILNNE